MTQLQPQLRFLRYEFKYILPLDLRVALESELKHFVELDPYIPDNESKKYFVRSLYYDDEMYSSFAEKADGQKTRVKFRVRTYTDSPSDKVPQFLELKGRDNQLVFKLRTPMEQCFTGNPTQFLLEDPNGDEVKEKFFYHFYKKGIRPVALIDYQRRPYISRYSPDFRLTFDDSIQVTHTNKMTPSPGETAHRVLPGYSIMEVKFQYRIPNWFHHIIQVYELRRESVSKICHGIETLGIEEDL